MLSCDETLEFISAALDGALTDAEQAELDEHLAHCPACSALFIELRDLHAVTAELDEIPAPVGFADQVMARIACPAQDQADHIVAFPSKKASHTAWKKWTVSAAVVAIVVLGAITLPGQLGANFQKSANDSAAYDAETLPLVEAANDGSDGFFDYAAGSDTACEESAVAENSSVSRVTSDSDETEGSFASQEIFQPQTAPAGDKATLVSGSAGLAAAYCGTLTLTGDVLPEGLEEFDATADSSGKLTYIVSADYFFSTVQTLDPEKFTYTLDKAASDPTAEYGLIIVEPSS